VVRVTDSDIRQAVSRSAVQAGLEYWAEDLVASVSPSRDGRLLRGSVYGSARKPYQQIIHLNPARDGGVSIRGSCSCPVGFNCKHVAAVLFAYKEQQGAGNDEPPTGAGEIPVQLPPRLAGALPPARTHS
jgi:uncharacterized Zn finger protein